MPILAVDIGNTHTHFGIAGADGVDCVRSLPTSELKTKANVLWEWAASSAFEPNRLEGLAFCSVVPDRTPDLVGFTRSVFPGKPTFQLTHESDLGFPIEYPEPSQIGQDRLANAVAAKAIFGAPAIVIDAGTAVTLDVITQTKGYEGGIIAPGLDVMRRYLHEQTALLPRFNSDFQLDSSIGRSTTEAMQIGCLIGFRGMIGSLVEAIQTELEERGEVDIQVIATGRSSKILDSKKDFPMKIVPDLTLRGLFEVFCLNEASAKWIEPDD
jgi:type III pantothenate kinase